MKAFATKFVISYDRGKRWQGPFMLPDFGRELTARTDYLVNEDGSCLVFLAAKETVVQAAIKDRAFCIYTADGGLTFEMRGYMTGEPVTVRSVMPTTVRGSKGQLLSALRRRLDIQTESGLMQNCWIDLYQSNDEGYTWSFLSRVADTGVHNGNPPSLVRLRDGRLCVTYGCRRPPFGIRAKVSRDEGLKWGSEIVLRADARTWDIGYPRTVQRDDGKLITIYYYTTAKDAEQHIAASLWEPGLG